MNQLTNYVRSHSESIFSFGNFYFSSKIKLNIFFISSGMSSFSAVRGTSFVFL